MKNKEWNPKDWQGRSQKQVETNYRVMEWAFGLLTLGFFGWVIYMVILNLT